MLSKWLTAVVLICAGRALAGDAITVTEITTTGTPEVVVFNTHSIIRATDDLILGRGPGAALADRDVTATMSIAGVQNALRFNLSADRTSATLVYPHNNASASFSAGGNSSYYTPARSIDDQIYNNITDQNNGQWGSLQQQLNHESYIMPGDGNPSAATAFLARETFKRYAMLDLSAPLGSDQSDFTVQDGPRARRAMDYFQPVYSFDVDGSAIQADGFSGYEAGFTFNAMGRILPWMGWSVSVPYRHCEVAGAQSDTVAFEAGLPFWIVRRGMRQPISWTLTPFAEFAYDESRDLGSESVIFDGGLASRLSVNFGRRSDWVLSWGSQFTGFTDIHATDHYGYNDNYYDSGDGYYFGNDRYTDMFRSHINQQIFRNALELGHRFRGGVSVDFSCAYSSFVQNAAVDQWWSPSVGLGWRIDDHFGLHVDYEADLANHYHAQGGRLNLEFRY